MFSTALTRFAKRIQCTHINHTVLPKRFRCPGTSIHKSRRQYQLNKRSTAAFTTTKLKSSSYTPFSSRKQLKSIPITIPISPQSLSLLCTTTGFAWRELQKSYFTTTTPTTTPLIPSLTPSTIAPLNKDPSQQHNYYFEHNHSFPTVPQQPTSSIIELYDQLINKYPNISTITPTVSRNDKSPIWGILHDDIQPDTSRVLVIGDIHGCYDELISLLTSVNYNPHNDILISLGDIIGKGPKGTQVIDFFYNLQRYVVEHIDNKNIENEKPVKQIGNFDNFLHFASKLNQKCDLSDDTYHKNAINLHNNSRVFVVSGNHEQFLLHYMDHLYTNNLFPHEAIIPTTTHHRTAVDFYAPTEENLTTRAKIQTGLKNGTIALQNSTTLGDNTGHDNDGGVIPNHELIEYFTKRNYFAGVDDDFTQLYKSNTVQAQTRLQWLRFLPQFVAIPQVNLVATHAGIPPDSCQLYSTNMSNLKTVTPQVNHMTNVITQTNKSTLLNLRSIVNEDPKINPFIAQQLQEQKQNMKDVDIISNIDKSYTVIIEGNNPPPVDSSKSKLHLKTRHFKPKQPISPLNQPTITWATAYSNRITQHKKSNPNDLTVYPHVLFGHDAVAGLQLETHATGIDTGCCYGKKLSGLVYHLIDRKDHKRQLNCNNSNDPNGAGVAIVDNNNNVNKNKIDPWSPKFFYQDTDGILMKDNKGSNNGVERTTLPNGVYDYPTKQPDVIIPMDYLNTLLKSPPILVQVESTLPCPDWNDD